MSGGKEKIYVSIGADCSTATVLKDHGKRKIGFPFDWTVFYKDVNEIFKSDFVGLGEDVEIVHHQALHHDVHVNKKYKILFLHHRGSDHLPQCIRRSERLLNLMKNGEKYVIFIRSSHRDGHHQELIDMGIDSAHFDETKDIIELKNFLRSKYPSLKFKIYLYNQCKLCNDQTTIDEENVFIKHIEHEQLGGEINSI